MTSHGSESISFGLRHPVPYRTLTNESANVFIGSYVHRAVTEMARLLEENHLPHHVYMYPDRMSRVITTSSRIPSCNACL
jgi:hypothetical protein